MQQILRVPSRKNACFTDRDNESPPWRCCCPTTTTQCVGDAFHIFFEENRIVHGIRETTTPFALFFLFQRRYCLRAISRRSGEIYAHEKSPPISSPRPDHCRRVVGIGWWRWVFSHLPGNYPENQERQGWRGRDAQKVVRAFAYQSEHTHTHMQAGWCRRETSMRAAFRPLLSRLEISLTSVELCANLEEKGGGMWTRRKGVLGSC